MRPCPACSELGIREHSVVTSYEALMRLKEEPASAPPVYSRCVRCAAAFRRLGPEELAPAPEEETKELHIRLLPPWKQRSDENELLLSFDSVEAFYEQRAHEIEEYRLFLPLIGELRAAGLDRELRAGQSMTSLGLSRARKHGLREGQSHLFLHPTRDGRVSVRGLIAGEKVSFGPVAAAYKGALREAIERLRRVPID